MTREEVLKLLEEWESIDKFFSSETKVTSVITDAIRILKEDEAEMNNMKACIQDFEQEKIYLDRLVVELEVMYENACQDK